MNRAPACRRRERRDLLAAAGFLAPNFAGFLLFVAYPIVFSLWLVFTNWSLKPAIETRWVGLSNVRDLLGFQPVPDFDGSDVGAAMAAWIAAWAIFSTGLLATLLSMNRKWNGVRGGGWLALAGGLLMTAASVATHSHPGWGLFGAAWALASIFMILDDDCPVFGAGIAGPLLVTAGAVAIRLLHEPFLERWQARDPLFWKYLYNTLFLMFLIPLQIAGSLGLALVLSRTVSTPRHEWRRPFALVFLGLAIDGGAALWLVAGMPDGGVLWAAFFGIAALGLFFGNVSFRTLFFIPSFTAGVAIMLLWKQMFNPDFGLLNEPVRMIYSILGIDAALPRWILDPHLAKPSLILMGFWTLVGGTNMLVYLAGLAGISDELYEAASIDGAGPWQKFRNVTWPQLAPTTFYIVVMTLIAGIQGGFEQARVMTEGGPAGATKTLSFYIYEKAFQELNLGYASAIAWIMFLAIFGLTALNWKFGNRYVND